MAELSRMEIPIDVKVNFDYSVAPMELSLWRYMLLNSVVELAGVVLAGVACWLWFSGSYLWAMLAGVLAGACSLSGTHLRDRRKGIASALDQVNSWIESHSRLVRMLDQFKALETGFASLARVAEGARNGLLGIAEKILYAHPGRAVLTPAELEELTAGDRIFDDLTPEDRALNDVVEAFRDRQRLRHRRPDHPDIRGTWDARDWQFQRGVEESRIIAPTAEREPELARSAMIEIALLAGEQLAFYYSGAAATDAGGA